MTRSTSRTPRRLLPDVTFHLREKEKDIGEFRWVRRTTKELFCGKRIVLIGVPAAFSPVCSDAHLPDYERLHGEITAAGGVDEVWCTSVNDAFVMFRWAKSLGVKKVRMLPDGNGQLASGLGMLVRHENKGYGCRSWRYAAVVDDMRIEALFEEPHKMDDSPVDPLTVSGASQGVLPYLLEKNQGNYDRKNRAQKGGPSRIKQRSKASKASKAFA